nr:motile sperm domain-containing protein 2 isoform X2 [Parasteatoda tepidariorum]
MPIFKNKFFVEDDHIKELRRKFLDDIKCSDEKVIFHPDDVQRVKDNDWFIARYLLHVESDVDKALIMLNESLKHRSEMGVNTLRKKDLPRDYFSVRAVLVYGQDHRNHPIIAIRCKTHFKKEDMKKIQQQYFIYWLEKALKMSDWGVVTILFDCTDSGVANMDLDMMRYIFEVFKKYCPWGLGYFLVYNMPWYLSAFWKIIKQWIPERYVSKIIFCDSKSIKNYINEDQLPVSLGGKCTQLYEPKEGVEDDEDSE